MRNKDKIRKRIKIEQDKYSVHYRLEGLEGNYFCTIPQWETYVIYEKLVNEYNVPSELLDQLREYTIEETRDEFREED